MRTDDYMKFTRRSLVIYPHHLRHICGIHLSRYNSLRNTASKMATFTNIIIAAKILLVYSPAIFKPTSRGVTYPYPRMAASNLHDGYQHNGMSTWKQNMKITSCNYTT